MAIEKCDRAVDGFSNYAFAIENRDEGTVFWPALALRNSLHLVDLRKIFFWSMGRVRFHAFGLYALW